MSQIPSLNSNSSFQPRSESRRQPAGGLHCKAPAVTSRTRAVTVPVTLIGRRPCCVRAWVRIGRRRSACGLGSSPGGAIRGPADFHCRRAGGGVEGAEEMKDKDDEKPRAQSILFPSASGLVQADSFTFPCFPSASSISSQASVDSSQDWLKCSSFAGFVDSSGDRTFATVIIRRG